MYVANSQHPALKKRGAMHPVPTPVSQSARIRKIRAHVAGAAMLEITCREMGCAEYGINAGQVLDNAGPCHNKQQLQKPNPRHRCSEGNPIVVK